MMTWSSRNSGYWYFSIRGCQYPISSSFFVDFLGMSININQECIRMINSNSKNLQLNNQNQNNYIKLDNYLKIAITSPMQTIPISLRYSLFKSSSMFIRIRFSTKVKEYVALMSDGSPASVKNLIHASANNMKTYITSSYT